MINTAAVKTSENKRIEQKQTSAISSKDFSRGILTIGC